MKQNNLEVGDTLEVKKGKKPLLSLLPVDALFTYVCKIDDFDVYAVANDSVKRLQNFLNGGN